ncbi:MAG: branched chain amino acid aminotransferase, partial [Candidatus Dormibacteraceae bacterium]
MTAVLPVSRTENPHPVSAARRAEIMAAPGFGSHFTDHMVQIHWDGERGWHDAAVVPYGPLALDPGATVLHYAQTIFEGLKAYRQPDGSIAAFRPDANARRFQRSARRLALPELPADLFVESLRWLVREDRDWVPAAGGEECLYVRPIMFGTHPGLGVHPSPEVLY